jgi:hypothetical protein
MTRITDTLHEGQYTFFNLSHSVLLGIRDVSDKFSEKIRAHIICSIPLLENRAVCEIKWRSLEEMGRAQMILW